MNKLIKKSVFGILTLFFTCNILHADTHWETPVVLGTNSVDNPDGSPTIVADDTGNSAVVWGEAGEVWASFRPAGGTWETPINFGKGVDPDVCIDQNGNVTVAFLSSGANGVVHAVYRPSGGTWISQGEPHIDGGKVFEDVAVVCTSASTQATIVWSNTTDSTIQSVSRVGTTWATAVTASSLGAGSITSNSKPQLFMLPNGSMQMTFYRDTASQGIYYTTGTSPALGVVSWAGPTAIAGFGVNSVKYSFAMNSSGNGVIVSQETGSALSAVQISGSWGAGATATGLSNVSNVSVGLDDSGLATAIWRITTDDAIQTKSTPITSPSWASPITLSTGVGNATPILDVNHDGHMIAGWRDGGKLFNTKRGENGTFESSTALVTTNQVDLSTIATNAEGRGFTTWTETAGLTTVSVTFEPINPTKNLLKALGKKRLIFQQTRYP